MISLSVILKHTLDKSFFFTFQLPSKSIRVGLMSPYNLLGCNPGLDCLLCMSTSLSVSEHTDANNHSSTYHMTDSLFNQATQYISNATLYLIQYLIKHLKSKIF